MAISGKVFTMSDSNTETLGNLLKQLGGLLGVGARSDGRYYLSDMCQASSINKWAKYKPVRHSTVANITEAQRKSVNYGLEVSAGYDNDAANNNTMTPFNHLRPRGKDYNEYNRLRDFDGYNHIAVASFFTYFKTAYTSEKLRVLEINTFFSSVADIAIAAAYTYEKSGTKYQTEYVANQEIPITELSFKSNAGSTVKAADCKLAVTNVQGGTFHIKSASGLLGAPVFEIPLLSNGSILDDNNTSWPQDSETWYTFYPRIKEATSSNFYPTGESEPLKLRFIQRVPFGFNYVGSIVFYDVTNAKSLADFTPSTGGSVSTNLFNGVSGSSTNWGTSSSPITLRLTLSMISIVNTDTVSRTTTLGRLRLTIGGKTFVSESNGESVTIAAGGSITLYGKQFTFKNFYTTLVGGGGSATSGRANFPAPELSVVNASEAYLTSDPKKYCYYH